MRLKTVLLIITLLTLTGVARKQVDEPVVKPSPTVRPSVLPSVSPVVSPSVLPMVVPHITIKKMLNYTAMERANALKAEKKIQTTLESDCFKKFMLKTKMTETNGKSNQKIYEMFRDVKASLKLSMYSAWWSKAVGYVNGDGYIYTNRRFHAGAAPCDVASNLVHEVAHDPLGFTHYKAWDSSVPYSINDAFDECCK